MLIHLSVWNFAIIDQLELDFTPGLNVLTGETGAGKSIILEALATLRGSHVGDEVIRWGEDEARIDAVFKIEPGHCSKEISEILLESGIDLDDHHLILTRELKRGRSNLCRINGRVTTLSLLSGVAQQLVDLHAQGEQASLIQPRKQHDLLDRFAGVEELRDILASRVKRLRQVQRQLKGLQIDEREMARRIDRLQYEIEEISRARLELGEDGALEQELRVLSNAEKVIHLADSIYRCVDSGTEREPSARDQLANGHRMLKQLVQVDDSMAEKVKMVEEVLPVLEELGRGVRAYRDSVELDPRRLVSVEERLRLINDLKRKYGDSIEEILDYLERAKRELEAISSHEQRVNVLEEKSELLSEIASFAGELSTTRLEASKRLQSEIEEILPTIGMDGVRFRVAVEREEGEGITVGQKSYRLNETGIDRVEFLVATANGEPLKPLRKIASSGEICRTMLAIRSVLCDADQIPVLVFDEIDSGMGARGGAVIGEKLLRLSRSHQVVCVTHLPQIASLAGNHLRITKEKAGCRTVTKAWRLLGDARIEELNEMMGSVGAHGRQGAIEMYEAGQKRREAEVSARVQFAPAEAQ
ncbi:MAG TPA: DNA repair protein RecN [Chloroflexi bacterium]|nr:DNA repair protein RecN [Chloroflexota bacterium]